MTAPPLRVMVVDDHSVVRSGVKALIAAEPDMRVVAEAGTVADAIEAAATAQPDVVVMDVRLADGSGIEAMREIRARRPATRVLMFTSFVDEHALFSAILGGAAGFVLKRITENDLVTSVRRVGAGESMLDPAVTGTLLERLRQDQRSLKDVRLSRLTPREEEILALVADGLTNPEIGAQLGMSEKTVRNAMTVILSKLEVGRRSEAAAYLVRHTPIGETV